MATMTARLEAAALEPPKFEVAAVSGREELSQLYALQIRIVGAAGASLDEDALLGASARLVLSADGVPVRYVNGVVHRIESDLHAESATLAWDVILVPRVFALTLGRTTEIAMDATVPEIVEERLGRAGLKGGEDFELALHDTYAKREFVVQFKESHGDFVTRLTEHLGITYFFRQTEEKEVLVFSDSNDAMSTESDGVRIPFRARGEKMDVFELRSVSRVVPAQVAVRDYNYRTPDVELAKDGATESQWGEQFEYGGHFKTPDEAAHVANVRTEELACRKRVFHGKSARPELSPGTRMTLEGHPGGDKQLLVIAVEHRLEQAAFGSTPASGGGYENSFVAIDAKVPFRPERRTPKPFVPGVLTATVEAEQAGEYAEIDGDGRYHVRFAFDRSKAERGKASRPIRMAQPHAGAGYGFHFPLRDGVEVLISCVEGDPDRPIIAGAIPNPTTPSTVSEKNTTRNVIRTGGGTEINIDDTVGSERLKISVPFGNTVLQLGAPNAPTPGFFIGTDKRIHLTSNDGMNFIDTTKISLWSPHSSIFGIDKAELFSNGATQVAGPLTQVHAGKHLELEAPLITQSAEAVWTASAGAIIVVHAGASVQVSAPSVTIIGDGVNITGMGSVNVTAPTVNIGGGTVNVKAGAINLNS